MVMGLWSGGMGLLAAEVIERIFPSVWARVGRRRKLPLKVQKNNSTWSRYISQTNVSKIINFDLRKDYKRKKIAN